MPNDYFKFKQFTIWQDQCAMKVGTDSVLLGAWADVKNAKYILDIGSGTGLIALMTAQKSEAQIDAIEIEEKASVQAAENFHNSPWSDRLNIHHQSFQTYVQTCKRKYDVIISNPPFFEKSLTAPNETRTIARHASHLPLCDLFSGANTLLSNNGKFYLITPYEHYKHIEKYSSEFLFYNEERIIVKPSARIPPKRILYCLSKNPVKNPIIRELIIEKKGQHNYSDEYIELTRDFYLKF